jgi:type II secretory pathway predicted ATPase ExeA
MLRWLEQLIARFWNRRVARRASTVNERALELGAQVVDDQPTHRRITVSQRRRAEHMAVLGKTGSGKSFLLRYLATQDIGADRGFVYFDLHGDATTFLMAAIAVRERAVKRDLSDRLIVIEPADADASVGLNPLEQQSGTSRFVQVIDFAQILKQRWQLDSFGARTDELLRNSLLVLAENRLTLLELVPLLTHAAYRASCLKRVTNAEVKQYFELRFEQASEPMQAVMREPILNKTSAFTGDPHFRHVIGQARSTFSVLEAMDSGRWIILNLHKGRLGEQAATLGSLFFTVIKNALFSRASRALYTLYCDEIQNFVAFGSGIEMVLSESRKFGVSIISANQFLDQYPPDMRAAILAVGTHIFFQLSSSDAHQIAAALDGGKPLAELLKNLPPRHMVVKTGHERWREAGVPTVREPKIDWSDLYVRSRARWARKREEIEEEIRARQGGVGRSSKEVLDDWE